MDLFVEQFLISVAEPDGQGPQPQPLYDEARSLNLDPEGRVFVEQTHVGGTETLTEVRGEHGDDKDFEDDRVALTGTTTKVRQERPDFELDGLHSDQNPVLLGTETAIGGEPSDYLRGDSALGTRTSIAGEKEDFAPDLTATERSPRVAHGA